MTHTLTETTAAGIRLEALSKVHSTMIQPALDGVDLTVEPGEFLTLLGPSGSGKSTLLSLLAGFAEPTSGRVIVDGHDITQTPPHRRNIGMVFQNYALFPHMSAVDNVAFGLRRRGIDRRESRKRATEALEKVDLHAMAERRPDELSGGQQQRVAVARAIVFGPSLVLMDEPFGALDRRLREGMQLEMMRLHREIGMTFVFVTHDQEEALSMSDRVAVLEAGRMEQIGTPAELYERPDSLFVARFLGASNLFKGRMVDARTLETSVGRLQVPDVVCPGRGVLMVRPEDVRVVTGPYRSSDGVNAVPCQVEETVYFGSSRRITLTFATGDTGMVHARSRDHDVKVGDRIHIEWNVNDGHLIPQEQVLDDDAPMISEVDR